MTPLQVLRHHVTGAIERGEGTAIVAQTFYEVTLFDGEESFDIHVFYDGTWKCADNKYNKFTRSRARRWIRKGYYWDDDAPGWVIKILRNV